ncbi:hypothetical protein K402DRAFT_330627 [Aulographum hederae CBS 113979]|uniref:RNA polymerase II subunit B1 CTD phosphatase RPAP2 homolog n=1 Tax=Aulographum hederae CBS 113979 TaxID=1176131 RepID=A0A6G1H2L1_9PEZI|nr:hypothetical protein K402DRAFT_330627 [Aulographum hederae CBS 113979]
MAPKSILKKTPQPGVNIPSTLTSSGAPRRRDPERDYALALHHANLIQQQKDAEAANLSAIETLLDYPTDPSADPAQPSASDAANFKRLVSAFQPADYDSLLEERTISDLCGYALCPRARRKEKEKQRFQVTDGKLKVLPKNQVDMWCSDDCARRALYVKVQLLEEPAWMRGPGVEAQIELLAEGDAVTPKEPSASFTADLPVRTKKPEPPPQSEEDIAWAEFDRARKQGYMDSSSGSSEGLIVVDNIQENNVNRAPEIPKPDAVNPFAIEGYDPKLDLSKLSVKDTEDSQDEESDNDWGI